MKVFVALASLWIFSAALRAEVPEVATDLTSTQSGELIIHLSFLTSASPEKLWKAITDSEELSQWAAKKARVELRLGGAYEYYYRPDRPVGRRGMEGTRIVSFVPSKMLSFASGAGTWTVWSIEPAGDRQMVHFYMLGTGADWLEKGPERVPALTELVEKLARHVTVLPKSE